MDPQTALKTHRGAILDVALRNGATNVRVFGSVARGTSRPDSDLDLLVTMLPGKNLLDVIAIEQDLTELLGVRVQVVTEDGLKPRVRDMIPREAAAV